MFSTNRHFARPAAETLPHPVGRRQKSDDLPAAAVDQFRLKLHDIWKSVPQRGAGLTYSLNSIAVLFEQVAGDLGRISMRLEAVFASGQIIADRTRQLLTNRRRQLFP